MQEGGTNDGDSAAIVEAEAEKEAEPGAEPKPEAEAEAEPKPEPEPEPEPEPKEKEEEEEAAASVTSEPAAVAKMVKAVGSLTELQTELTSAGTKLIVIDFSATWCGPCKMIKPFFHTLVEKYPDVVFIEIDVDDAQDVAAHCDVKCMPTFQFYKNNEKVHEFSGANKEKLEEAIKKYM